jgi:hypothetical protein
MAEDDRDFDELVLTQLLRFNAVVSGIITGLVAGLGIFVATNWLVIKGGPVVGPHLSLLGEFFIGYQVTFLGSLVGFAYGLAGGFVVGYFVARIYNWLVDIRNSRGARAKARERQTEPDGSRHERLRVSRP